MENQNQFQQPQIQKSLPNATTALVLGILSIILCFCYGLIGLALGIIGLVLANKDRKLFRENPGMFTEGSYRNLNAGRVCSIIGIILSSCYLIYVIIVLSIFGFAIISNPSHIFEQMQNLR